MKKKKRKNSNYQPLIQQGQVQCPCDGEKTTNHHLQAILEICKTINFKFKIFQRYQDDCGVDSKTYDMFT